MARKESSEWRELLNQVDKDMAGLPADIGAEGRAFVEFLIERANNDLSTIESITRLLREKKYTEALAAFRSLESKYGRTNPPRIATVLPKRVEARWVNSDTYEIVGNHSAIAAAGWNIFQPTSTDVPTNLRRAYRVQLRNPEDTMTLAEAPTSLTLTDNYLLQVTLAGQNRVPLLPKYGKLRVVCGNEAANDWTTVCTLPIIFNNKRPAREDIVALTYLYQTTDEDKDNDQSHVGAVVYRSGRSVLAPSQAKGGDTQGPDDPNRVWKDWSRNGPFRLNLAETVPWSSVGEMTTQITHRRLDGDPAWRFRVEIDAVVRVSDLDDDGNVTGQREETRRVHDEYDDDHLFNHKPGNRRDWSFDLRGKEKDFLKTPPIPLRAH
jgi:hypothetical protein